MKIFINSKYYGIILLLLFVSASRIFALSDGYILAGAYSATSTALLDQDGEIVKQWQHSTLNGYSCYLLPNGNLLRSFQVDSRVRVHASANPKQGGLEEVDSTGKIVWTYTLANDTLMLHHDMKLLPNGNILAVTYHAITKARMRTVGIDTNLLKSTGFSAPTTMLAEKIVEIKPKYPSGGDIVWEWRIIDHIAQREEAAAHPELISGYIISEPWAGQWVHLNGIDYNPKTNLIVFSSRIFSELFVIERPASTQEASGHTGGKYKKGGDILYRWGKPSNYGASGATTIDCLHSVTWIPEGYPGAGNILFYHNNINAVKSEVIEIKPPLDDDGNFIKESGKPFGPSEPTWKYAPGSNFYSQYMSSTMRMPNGNTVVHEAYPASKKAGDMESHPATNSIIREVDKDGQVIWTTTLTMKSQGQMGMNGFNPAKIMYYPSSYEGVIKLLNLPPVHTINSKAVNGLLPDFRISRRAGSVVLSGVNGNEISIVTMQGKKIFTAFASGNEVSFKTGDLPSGIYYIKVTGGGEMKSVRSVAITR